MLNSRNVQHNCVAHINREGENVATFHCKFGQIWPCRQTQKLTTKFGEMFFMQAWGYAVLIINQIIS